MRVTFYLFLAFLFAACGQPGGVLSGGQKDTTPPTVVGSSPASPATRFSGSRITFVFDEFIKTSATYGKEVFISPAPAKNPKITVVNKRLRVHFQAPLRDSTTYVVSVRDVGDYNAGNKQAVAFVGAFSTGNTLDSACIRGIMRNTDSTPVSNATLLLFAADSARGDSIMGKVPAYMARTSEGGTFEFPYLRGAAYRIYGITDSDNTNSFTAGDDGLALALAPLITVGKRDTVDSVGLVFFKPDSKAPLVRNARWIGQHTLSIGLSEGLKTDSLSIFLSDTTGSDKQELMEFSLIPGKEGELLVHTHRTANDISTLTVSHLCDSVGNFADTTLRVLPGRTRTLDGPLLVKPAFNAKENALVFLVPEWLDSLPRSEITVIDTAKKAGPVALTWNQYRVSAALKGKVPPGGLKLMIPGRLLPAVAAAKDTAAKDTTYAIVLTFPDPTQFGLVAGKVATPGYDGPVVVSLVPSGKRGAGAVYDGGASSSREFRFTMVPPGKYKLLIVKDIDNNHQWTTGGLHPYRLPEQTRYTKEEIEIKANWELEDQQLKW